MRILLRLSFIVITILVLVLCQGVKSEISIVESGPAIVKPTETLAMSCKVTGGSLALNNEVFAINWFRRTAQKQLEWLGRLRYDEAKSYAASVQNRLTITRDTKKGEVYFTLTAAKPEDSGRYYAVKEGGGFDLWSKGSYVEVTTAQQRGPSVFPLVPCCDIVSSLSSVTIGCLSTGYLPEPVDVTWNSGSITTGIRSLPGVRSGKGDYISTSFLTVSPTDFKNNKYTCNVNHKATSTRINKDIEVCEDATPIPPTVQVMQGSCGETGSVDLVCLVSGYTPDDIKIKWLLNGKETSISPTNSTPYKDSEGHFGSRSQVSVPKEDWFSGDTYTCRVSHPPSDTRNDKSIHKCSESSSSSSSVPKVILNQPSPRDLLYTKEPKITCEVSKLINTDSLTFKWRRNDGKKITKIEPEPEQQFDGTYTAKSTLRISIADWDSGKIFTCTVEHNDLPSPVEKTIHKRDEPTTEPSIYLYAPSTEELSTSDVVTLICLMKKFSPSNLDIQWKKNDIVIDQDDYINTEPILDEATDTYFIYSTLNISKSDWNRGARYTCTGFLGKITEKEIKKNRGK